MRSCRTVHSQGAAAAAPLCCGNSLYLHSMSRPLQMQTHVAALQWELYADWRQLACMVHQVPRFKADASARVARSLADAYEAVYQAVGDSSSGYVQAGQPCPLPHTPEQVRTILGVVTDF